MVARIRKNDTVVVVSGKDKGKQGVVLKVFPDDAQVLVKGVGLTTRHIKSRKKGQASERKVIEQNVPACKVMPWCHGCQKAARINVRTSDQNRHIRVCNRCKEAL